MTTMLSVARRAQDELLRLEALLWRDLLVYSSWNVARFMRLRGEVATREADELNHLHQPEIALAHANVVNCDMVATALHKVATAEITMQWVERKVADATDLHSDAAMVEGDAS